MEILPTHRYILNAPTGYVYGWLVDYFDERTGESFVMGPGYHGAISAPPDNLVVGVELFTAGEGRTELAFYIPLPERSDPALPVLTEVLAAIEARWPEMQTTDSHDSVYVPKRQGDRIKWRRAWRLINGQIGRKSIDEISLWLKDMHPALPNHRETLAQIIRAGEAGRLN